MNDARIESRDAAALRPGKSRRLTRGEVELVKSIFREAIDCDGVRVLRRKYFPFQPRSRTMAPNGNIYFHPRSPRYRDDFSLAEPYLQGLFVHEMTHVWQHQIGINVRKAMFDRRYRYRLERGKPFSNYGLEQQCEIVRDYFLVDRARKPDATLKLYADLVPFPRETNV